MSNIGTLDSSQTQSPNGEIFKNDKIEATITGSRIVVTCKNGCKLTHLTALGTAIKPYFDASATPIITIVDVGSMDNIDMGFLTAVRRMVDPDNSPTLYHDNRAGTIITGANMFLQTLGSAAVALIRVNKVYWAKNMQEAEQMAAGLEG